MVDQLIFSDAAAVAGVPIPYLTLNTVGPTIMRYVEVAGDRVEHLLRGLSQPALDLRHVGIGDADHVGEPAHRERVQLPLAADDLPERGSLVGHESRIRVGPVR